MPKTLKRRQARIKAIILLYQNDLLNKDIEKIISGEMLFGKRIDDFAIKLALGVGKNKKKIDDVIKKVVENWTIDRIAIIDRNIIRTAIYEMLFEDDIPLKVSVDEAIEISKMLGQKKDTPKFVNGILGKILTNIQEES
jgi:transcription antitermination protein NusB